MPSISKAQHGAMEASAHGKSTAGIPKRVGQDFAAADKAKGKKMPTDAMVKAMRGRKPPMRQDMDEDGA